MIVSTLESVVVRLMLGGILDANERKRIDALNDPNVNAFLDLLKRPGTTPAAQQEIDEGQPVRWL